MFYRSTSNNHCSSGNNSRQDWTQWMCRGSNYRVETGVSVGEFHENKWNKAPALSDCTETSLHKENCTVHVCVFVCTSLVVILGRPSSKAHKDKDRVLIRTKESYAISVSGASRLTPDPDTHRSIQFSLPADSQIVVAVQPFDGHHSHIHRCDFQNT